MARTGFMAASGSYPTYEGEPRQKPQQPSDVGRYPPDISLQPVIAHAELCPLFLTLEHME